MKGKHIKLTTFALVLGLMLMSIPAFAAMRGDHERVRMNGTVTAMDVNGQNFTISDRNNNVNRVMVNQATEFEVEEGRHFWDGRDEVPFSTLKVGDNVRVKTNRVNGQLEATDVEIHRAR